VFSSLNDAVPFPKTLWIHLLFEGNVFLLGYSGKGGFLKGQKHLLILLGFWGNFVIIFTGNIFTLSG